MFWVFLHFFLLGFWVFLRMCWSNFWVFPDILRPFIDVETFNHVGGPFRLCSMLVVDGFVGLEIAVVLHSQPGPESWAFSYRLKTALRTNLWQYSPIVSGDSEHRRTGGSGLNM